MSIALIRKDDPSCESVPSKSKLIQRMTSLEFLGNKVYVYGLTESEAYMKDLINELCWTHIEDRTPGDIPKLGQFFNGAYHNSENRYVILAHFQEIFAIRNSYGLSNILPQKFDVLMLDHKGGMLLEEFISLDIEFDPTKTLTENLTFAIREKIYPNVIENEAKINSKTIEINKNLDGVQKKIRKAFEKFERVGGRKNNEKNNNGLENKLAELRVDLSQINKSIEYASAKSYKICKSLQKMRNDPNFNHEEILSNPSVFSTSHIDLTQRIDPSNSFHLITIQNNTNYYFKNLVIYIPTVDSLLYKEAGQGSNQIVFDLRPKEIKQITEEDEIEFNIDYILDHGYFVMQLKYFAHVISNDCIVSRFILGDLVRVGPVHKLFIKNIEKSLKGFLLRIIIVSTREEIHMNNLDIGIRTRKEYDIRGLPANEKVHISAWFNNRLISEEKIYST